MKIAYFDCFNGISGDMTVGAFLDTGLKMEVLKKQLRSIDLKGYEICAGKVSRCGITGTKFDVIIKSGRPGHHAHTTYGHIRRLIGKSGLNNKVKGLALSIFRKLASAEARIHGVKEDNVRFHEAGAVDSIVDIVSSSIAVTFLGIEKFYCINLRLGQGNIRTRHGELPLPAPAVLELLKGKPLRFSDQEYELVTPTGAAILTTLVEEFDVRPDINVERIGYGAGTIDPETTPNMLRVFVGTRQAAALDKDEIMVLETNIDDMSPVYYEYLMEKLFKNGALDVYMTPIYMKKTRPAVLLTVLAGEDNLDHLTSLLMRETTTSGVRYSKVQRNKLNRLIKTVKTRHGNVKVKINTGTGGIRTVSPEYEDCKDLALKTGVPFKIIYNEAQNKA